MLLEVEPTDQRDPGRKWLRQQRSRRRRRFGSIRWVAAPLIRPRRTAVGGVRTSFGRTIACLFGADRGGQGVQ